MIGQFRPTEDFFLQNYVFSRGRQKGGEITINVGRSLTVEQLQQQPSLMERAESFGFDHLSRLGRAMGYPLESERAFQVRKYREELGLDESSKYLLFDVGHVYAHDPPVGYQCGRIRINMNSNEDRKWRYTEYRGYHYQIYEDLKCILLFEGSDWSQNARIL